MEGEKRELSFKIDCRAGILVGNSAQQYLGGEVLIARAKRS